MPPIPFQNLRLTHEPFAADFLKDVAALLKAPNPDFIGSNSRTVGEFECDFAKHAGCKWAFGLNSGTDALLLPLDALGVGPGDEVIVPAFGFIATADVVARLGATPVFADIHPGTFNIDPAAMEAAITPRTKALIPVHLFGQAADMDVIMEIANRHGIPVIEDVAQATGAMFNGQRVGTMGDFGAFSFYPTKNLGGAGDGGLVTVKDDTMAEKIRLFRDHGRDATGAYAVVGYNSRLDALQAKYLHYKLPELDDALQERIENARLYNTLFADSEVGTPPIPDDEFRHTFNLYTIRVRDRTRLQAWLKEMEVGCAVYYPIAMPLAPALARYGAKPGQFPMAEAAARTVLSLPVWPGLKRKEIERVAEAVLRFLENNPSMELRK